MFKSGVGTILPFVDGINNSLPRSPTIAGCPADILPPSAQNPKVFPIDAILAILPKSPPPPPPPPPVFLGTAACCLKISN